MRFLRKNWILVWVVTMALGLASFWGYAEFIELHNNTQKVVANTSDSRQRFSSDYLSTGAPSSREIGKTVVEGQLYYEVPFKIWNYDSSNSARYYTSKLEYTITAQLVHGSNTLITDAEYSALNSISSSNSAKVVSDIGIKYSTDENFVTFASAVAGYTAAEGYKISISEPDFTGTTVDGETTYQKAEHIYILRFPAAMLANNENVFVRLTAQPGPNNSELNPLYAVLSVTGSSAVLEDGWSGKFNDDTTVSGSAFDGYNYVISGNGSANITFSWDPAKFEVSRFFLSDIGVATPETKTVYIDSDGKPRHKVNGVEVAYTSEDEGVNPVTWNCFNMYVHSDDEKIEGVTVSGKNRYDIQLYMRGDPSADYGDWDIIGSYVDFAQVS